MSSLVITVSGSDGGNGGPQGIYRHFPKYWGARNVSVINIDTIPEEVISNINHVFQTAQENGQKYERIYLVGYSMGGAVVIGAALELQKLDDNRLSGIGLISTQTEGLQCLKQLKVPVLFYHGSQDEYFPPWQVDPFFKSYQGEKKFVQMENLGHNLGPRGYSFVSRKYIKNLAKNVIGELSSFFKEGKPSVVESFKIDFFSKMCSYLKR